MTMINATNTAATVLVIDTNNSEISIQESGPTFSKVPIKILGRFDILGKEASYETS